MIYVENHCILLYYSKYTHYCYHNADWGGESQAAPTPYEALLHYSLQLLVIPLVVHLIAYSTTGSFPGHRRNGLATCVSSNCYFHCQKVGSTNQIQNIVT